MQPVLDRQAEQPLVENPNLGLEVHQAMRRIWCLLALAAILLKPGLPQQVRPAQLAHAPEESPTGVDSIIAYAGTWKITSERFKTAHSEPASETSTLHNVCLKSGGYVACNQIVDGVSRVLLVFTFNEKDHMYTSYQIPQGGGAAGSGKLIIAGNVWTFPWQSDEAGKTTYFRVVNVFTSAKHIESRQEFSTDNVNWTAMSKGACTKISED